MRRAALTSLTNQRAIITVRKWDLTLLSLHFHLLPQIFRTAVWVRRGSWSSPLLLRQQPGNAVQELAESCHTREYRDCLRQDTQSQCVVSYSHLELTLYCKMRCCTRESQKMLLSKIGDSLSRKLETSVGTQTDEETQRQSELMLFSIMVRSQLPDCCCVHCRHHDTFKAGKEVGLQTSAGSSFQEKA